MSWLSKAADSVGDYFSGVNPIVAAISPGYAFGMNNVRLLQGSLGQEQPNLDSYNNMMQIEWEKNRQMQYDFAKHGLGWMLDDAQSRGLSPLAAVGGRAPQYTPMSSGRVPIIEGQKTSRLGDVLNHAMLGLDVAMKIASIKQLLGQANYMNSRAAALNSLDGLEGAGDMVKSSLRNPSLGSGQPVPQTQSAAGSIPAYAYVDKGHGLKQVASDEMNERLMGNFTEMSSWAVTEGLRSLMFGKRDNEAPNYNQFPLPEGHKWRYNRWVHMWVPYDLKNKEYVPYDDSRFNKYKKLKKAN